MTQVTTSVLRKDGRIWSFCRSYLVFLVSCVSARFLQMEELLYECNKYLKSRTCISNCIILFDFANYHNLAEVSEATFDFILKNIWQLIEDKHFLVMTKQLVRQILLKSFLNLPSQEYVFKKFIQWVKYDLENRASDFIELLKLIKLPSIRPKLLKKGIKSIMNISKDASFSSNCYAIYLNILKDHNVSRKVKYNGKGATEQLLAVGVNKDYTFNLEVYNDVTKTWEVEWASVSLDEESFLDFHVVFQQNEIYILCEGLKNNFMRSFDRTQNRRDLRPMNIWRQGYSAVSDGRYIFVIGGYNNVPALHCVERYDFATNSWTEVASTIHPHRSPGLIAVNGIIFVFGGSTNTVEYYNPDRNEWQVLPPMMFTRSYPTVEYMYNRIFILGGSRRNEVEVFDVQQMNWAYTDFPILDMPPMTHNNTLCDVNITTGATFNNRLILFERFFSFLSFEFILAENDWIGFKYLKHSYQDCSIITAKPAFFD